MAEKVKLAVFEDGSDEQFLKLLKEFKIRFLPMICGTNQTEVC
jgi:hypothetical protein